MKFSSVGDLEGVKRSEPVAVESASASKGFDSLCSSEKVDDF